MPESVPLPSTTPRWSGNEYDPLLPESFDTPHEEFARLRRECPVAHGDAFGGFWILTRYADIARVLADPLEFTTRIRNVVPGASATGRRPPLHLDPPTHPPIARRSTARSGRSGSPISCR